MMEGCDRLWMSLDIHTRDTPRWSAISAMLPSGSDLKYSVKVMESFYINFLLNSFILVA